MTARASCRRASVATANARVQANRPWAFGAVGAYRRRGNDLRGSILVDVMVRHARAVIMEYPAL